VADAKPAWRVEDLNSGHDRAGFSCGQPSLDDFIKQYASQNQKSGVSRTIVALGATDTARVRGYYSLAAGSVAMEAIPAELRKRLPKYPVPVAHLGRLAADKSAQGQGLGSFLLIDALRRIERAANSIGVHAVEVVAIDDAAKNFYLKYGFVELADDRHHLYLPLSVVRKLGLG